jgi:hypothetical protein
LTCQLIFRWNFGSPPSSAEIVAIIFQVYPIIFSDFMEKTRYPTLHYPIRPEQLQFSVPIGS